MAPFFVTYKGYLRSHFFIINGKKTSLFEKNSIFALLNHLRMRCFVRYVVLAMMLMALPLKQWGQTIRNGFIEIELANITNPDFRYCLFSAVAQDDNISYIIDEGNSSVLLLSSDGWTDEQFQTYYDELKANAERDFRDFVHAEKTVQGASFARWKEHLPKDLFVLLFRQIMIEHPNNRDGNQTCATAEPFCTTDVVTFHVEADPGGVCETGPDYGCLVGSYYNYTLRPPFWFYMKIGIAGNFTIEMSNNTGLSYPSSVDIDYCCWGPFSDPVAPCPDQLTADKIIDCGETSLTTETCDIPNTSQVGEYYLLVITKYNQTTATDITFQKVVGSGPGETDCGILPGYASNDGPYCVGDDIHLTINEQEGASYSWSGPNGFSSTLREPTITNCTMADAGTYTCLVTVDTLSVTGTTEVVIYANPVAAFTFDEVCSGTPTHFTNTSTTNPSGQTISGYQWSFGDGGTSTQQNPNHTYTQGGTYQVTLTVNCGGICTDAITQTVTVYASPSANAGPDQTIAYGASAQLNGSAGSGTFTYQWSPENMINGASNIPNPQTVNLTATQTYTLTVTNPDHPECNGSDQVVIHINGGAMTVSANANPTTLCAGESTQLNAIAGCGTGSYTYSWSPTTGLSNPSIPNPTATPTQTTTYTCTVSDGQTTQNATVTVTVNPVPTASFTYTTVCEGNATQFNSTSTGSGITNYQWDFGDGQTGTGQNASHTYAQAGTYQVTLTVATANGACDNAITQSVTVNAQPMTSFNYTTVCRGTPTEFISTSTGQGITGYQWSFGDGQTGTGQNVSHTYAQAGTYTVTLTVTATGGCEDQATQSVSVNAMPIAEAGPDQTISYGSTAQLSGSGGAGTYYFHWEPANKVVNPNSQNTQTIALTDSQTFTLTVTNPQSQQCFDSDQVTIHITGGTMTVTVSPNASICQGGSTMIQANAGGGTGNFSYSWTPTTGLSNSHIYNPVASPMQTTTYTCTVSDGQTTQNVSTTVFVNDVIVEHEYVSICPGESYPWHGYSYNSTGVYEYNTTTPEGCAKTIYLHLELYPEYDETIINESICSGETYNFFGTTYNTSGQYQHTLQTMHGCDSIVRLNLTVYDDNGTTICPQLLCTSQIPWVYPYDPNQTPLYEGSYSFILQDIHGCDSLVILELEVSDYYVAQTEHEYRCYSAGETPSFTWEVNGQTYHENQYVQDTLPYGDCEGIFTLELQFMQIPEVEHTYAEVCNTYTWPVNGMTYTETTEDEHQISLYPFPCNKVYKLHLTVNHESVGNDTLIDCDNPDTYYCDVYPFYDPNIGDTLFFDKNIDTLLFGKTPDSCEYTLSFHLRNMKYTPAPVIRCSDQNIEFPDHPITATEFNVNRYPYYAIDPMSDATWINDSCQWSISKPSWRIDPSDDNRSCNVYAMDWVPDTIWLSFKAVNPCSSTIVRYGLVPSFYGIEETEAHPAAVSIIPNPNNGQMQLRFENLEGRMEIKVYTLTGALIDDFEVTTTQVGATYDYSMRRLQNGVYFFVISDGKRSVTKKVVIIW